MASIYQNEKTKKWEFVFDRYVDGKRKQVRRRGFKTKREANDEMVRLQKEVQVNEYVGRNYIRIGEWFEYWLENVRRLECEPTTYYNNHLYLKNHVDKAIGQIKLQDLTTAICQKFINIMHEDGYAPNTIDRVCTIVKLGLDAAIDYGLIKENVMRKTKTPRKVKNEIRYWTQEQANEFLKYTTGHRYFCGYALAIFTGMRQGEILGLRWKDIDFEKKTITVVQTLTHYGKSLKTGAKTIAGERIITISDQLVTILRKQRSEYISFKIKKESCKDMDLVIYNLKNGGTVFPGNFIKTYIRTVKKSGLPYIPFHGLRHTHATMLLANDINVKVISERLGHSKISVTLDTYSHVLPSMQQEVAEKLNKILSL